MESIIVPVITIAAGIYFFFRNIALWRDEEKLASYVQNSPRARPWVEKFGVDRTIHLMKRVLLPMGMVIAVLLLGIGIWTLLALS